MEGRNRIAFVLPMFTKTNAQLALENKTLLQNAVQQTKGKNMKNFYWTFILMIGLALFTVLMGCDEGDDADKDSNTNTDSDTNNTPFSSCSQYQNDPVTCLNTVCYSEVATHRRNPDSVLLADCIFACADGDQACADACGASYPNGVIDVNNYFGCFDTNCASCGDPADTTKYVVSDCSEYTNDWATCYTSECSAQTAACKSNEQCVNLHVCRIDCGDDEACQSQCYSTYPLGIPDYDAETQCGLLKCSNC